MTRIERSALVNYSAEQMFALVNDIESYPQFMHGCASARIISASEDELIGELVLSKAGIRQKLVTRNRLVPGRKMTMELVEGAFKSFGATWRFEPLSDSASKVSLVMEFEFSGGLMNFAIERLFSGSANTLVEAVVQRARKVYGE